MCVGGGRIVLSTCSEIIARTDYSVVVYCHMNDGGKSLIGVESFC